MNTNIIALLAALETIQGCHPAVIQALLDVQGLIQDGRLDRENQIDLAVTSERFESAYRQGESFDLYVEVAPWA